MKKLDPWHNEEYGPVCAHVGNIRTALALTGIDIYSEHGEPYGWVNVHCEKCGITYECLMYQPDEDEEG